MVTSSRDSWSRRRRRKRIHGGQESVGQRRRHSERSRCGEGGGPGDDLVSALIGARDGDERLDSQELLSTIFSLWSRVTTRRRVSSEQSVALFGTRATRKASEDPAKSLPQLEEFLRFDAPVPTPPFVMPLEPVTLAGQEIPAGAQVIICMAAANRDPRQIREPRDARPRP